MAGFGSRSLLVPCVVQCAAVDAVGAAAQALAAGFGLAASPLAVRGAASLCHAPDDDLTALGALLTPCGLVFGRVVLPVDCLAALAAQGPFVCATPPATDDPAALLLFWRRLGPLLHLLDTRAGRDWTLAAQLEDLVYETTYALPADRWLQQMAAMAGVFAERFARLTQETEGATEWLERVRQDAGWFPLATLDAALRFTERLVAAGSLEYGAESLAMLARLYIATLTAGPQGHGPIPADYWRVTLLPDQQAETLCCRGVALLHSVALAEAADDEALPRVSPPRQASSAQMLQSFWREQPARTALLAGGLALAAAGVVGQALILRGLVALGQMLPTVGERAAALGLVLGLVATLLLLELGLASLIARQGRLFDARLRLAFMTLLPRLGSASFGQFGTADLMERIHTVRDLHNVPELAGRMVRLGFQLLFTLVGIAFITPLGAALGLVQSLIVALVILAGSGLLRTYHRRLRERIADLQRLALDSLVGAQVVHAHLAAPALQVEHERLLARWTQRARMVARVELALALVVTSTSALAVAAIVLLTGWQGNGIHLPLLIFWSLQLGTLSEQLARLSAFVVGELSKGERYLALTELPLTPSEAKGDAPVGPHPLAPSPATWERGPGGEGHPSIAENPIAATPAAFSPSPTTWERGHEGEGHPALGVAISFADLAVSVAGQPILHAMTCQIAAGSHVALVGPSGAGKSTLLRLLLGQAEATQGAVLVDGRVLNEELLAWLRPQIAWVDPLVELWDRSLLANVTYGSGQDTLRRAINGVVGPLLEQLPQGMQSLLGERGRLIAGGQGQQVRFSRALQHPQPRLVLLDEPFRGLDGVQRRDLLAQARTCWPGATLICVTHDVAHTTDFARVLVLQDGRLVEDGAPATLATNPTSHYAALLQADETLASQHWMGEAAGWRRVALHAGALVEDAAKEREEAQKFTVPPPLSHNVGEACTERSRSGAGGEGHPSIAATPAASPPSPTTWERGPGGEGHAAPPDPMDLAWPTAQVPNMVAALAQRGFGITVTDTPLLLPQDERSVASQIGQLVTASGLEAEPFALQLASLDALLKRGCPAILQCSDGRWLALLRGGPWGAKLLLPTGTLQRLRLRELYALLGGEALDQAQRRALAQLEPLELSGRQGQFALRALLRDQLRDVTLAQGWSLRLAASAPLLAQMRRTGMLALSLRTVAYDLLLSLLAVASIAAAGVLALTQGASWLWLLGIALALFSFIPLSILREQDHFTFSLQMRVLLKRRWHAALVRLKPSDLQQYGSGQFLSWLLEAERLEAGVALRSILGSQVLALFACMLLFALGAAGGLLSLLLLVWLGVTAGLSWFAYRAYLAQRRCHIATSRQTLALLEGHQTRLMQENAATWHTLEDESLVRYLELARRDDRYRSLLSVLVPYGWLALAITALAPTLIAAPPSLFASGASLLGISWSFQLLNSLTPALLDLFRVAGAWRLLSPLEEAIAAEAPTAAASHVALPPPAAGQPILEARNLSFGYYGQRQPLINHCDLAIHRGERILLSGPVGSGKSTLAALLSRLRSEQTGLMLLHGLDQHTLAVATWRQQVLLVAQFHENQVFHGSFAFNLLMGRQWPPQAEDLQEAKALCHELGLGALLERMPHGLAQPIGTGGWELSHGERSRLFIARALLQRTPLLILDESLAAMDANTRHAVLTAICARTATVVLIVHQ
ncbi:MAG: ATP-binding cassette domain-containing protein [Candidatus Viridilinea halotolerans]|uniref:ATP-binding cassette domain-containing protein n=1 Tax=Candidatus Viridilinea halotolerans TaxID=2491704 RepID=A0A426U3P6_9CHLR|nr:MAG: ATP-binding cassette domain-containing protein [Candidatus Viridilinea halotolerans]